MRHNFNPIKSFMNITLTYVTGFGITTIERPTKISSNGYPSSTQLMGTKISALLSLQGNGHLFGMRHKLNATWLCRTEAAQRPIFTVVTLNCFTCGYKVRYSGSARHYPQTVTKGGTSAYHCGCTMWYPLPYHLGLLLQERRQRLEK